MKLTDEVKKSLGPAWSSVVLAMLGATSDPETWHVYEASGSVYLRLGGPEEPKALTINAGSVQQASVLQGMITVAKLALNQERDRVMLN